MLLKYSSVSENLPFSKVHFPKYKRLASIACRFIKKHFLNRPK